MTAPGRLAFRAAALLAMTGLAGCAVAPGPYQQQADSAAQACQQGIQRACYDYQALAPAAHAETAQQQQNAQVGTAVAAGVIGLAAGAAIASSARDDRRSSYRRPPPRRWDGPRGGYYR